MGKDVAPKDIDEDFDQEAEKELAREAFKKSSQMLADANTKLGVKLGRSEEIHSIIEGCDVLGWNSLATDLGAFSDPKRGEWPYSTSEIVRDDILAHGRQDAASTLGIASHTLNKVFEVDARVRRLEWLLAAILVISSVTLAITIFG